MPPFSEYSPCTEYNAAFRSNDKAENFYENSQNIGKFKFLSEWSIGLRLSFTSEV